MKGFLWIVFFTLGLLGVVAPAFYLYRAAKLPQLESEYDLETLLRLSVEGERMSIRAGRTEQDPRQTKFEKPEFAKLPKDLVALYISQLGCPTFFQTPREDGPKWGWRLFAGLMGSELPGDGGCERYLSMNISMRLGVKGMLDLTVAGNKLHGFLQKDQLVTYDLATMKFDRGVVGVEDASYELYRKKLADLNLAQLAEFTLALPMNGFYWDIKDCKNASLIKQTRDRVIKIVAAQGLVPPDKAMEAVKMPVACLDAP